MSIFDDGFDAEDALVLGGTIGFAEESIKSEEEGLDNAPEEDIDIDMSEIKEVNLRLIYNMNPDLFRYIMRIAKRQKDRWKKDRLARESVQEELVCLDKSENDD